MPKNPGIYLFVAVLLLLLVVENFAIFAINRRCGELEGQLRVLQVRVAQLSNHGTAATSQLHGSRAAIDPSMQFTPAARLLARLTVLQHDPQTALSADEIAALDAAISRQQAAFDSARKANQTLYALASQLDVSFTPTQQAYLDAHRTTVQSKAFELSNLAQQGDTSLYDMLREYVHNGCRPM